MKLKTILLALNLVVVSALPTRGADVFVRLNSTPGANRIRIEGYSSAHPWRSECSVIGGYAEVGEGFPLKPGVVVKPGKVDAKISIFIPVSRFKSLKEDGITPYSSGMDDRMYELLIETNYARITYSVTELTLKEAPKAADAPYQFDSKGELCVAGVTNKIAMPVTVTVLAENKVRFAGSVNTKMSDFKIKAPELKVLGLGISTADEVKLSFEWVAMKKSTNAPAATAK